MESPIIQSVRLLKATEVAEILNVSRSMAYMLMERGDLRTVVIGAARRVRPQDLETFIEKSLNLYYLVNKPSDFLSAINYKHNRGAHNHVKT